jgi:hypothetical protein
MVGYTKATEVGCRVLEAFLSPSAEPFRFESSTRY